MARAASALATLGGTSRLVAMPTAAPTSVSAIRSQAAASAPSDPTPSTSIPLIATSIRLSRSRSTWPAMIATKMSSPRLHHSSGTTAANPTARKTPVTTATHPVQPAREQGHGGDLDDQHRGQRREQGLGVREDQRRDDVAGDGGDRDPQRPQQCRPAIVAQPVQLPLNSLPPHPPHHARPGKGWTTGRPSRAAIGPAPGPPRSGSGRPGRRRRRSRSGGRPP